MDSLTNEAYLPTVFLVINIVLLNKRRHLRNRILARRRQLALHLVNMQYSVQNTIFKFCHTVPPKVACIVPPRIRRFLMKRRNTHFLKNLEVLNGEDYLEMFRMKKETFTMICNELHEILKPNKPVIIREPLSVEKKVAIALYKLASCAEYRVIGNVFGVHKSTVHNCLYQVVNAINEVLLPKYVSMPNEFEAQEIAQHIRDKTGIPQVLGAIDGTHIPILAPKVGYRDYVNRKGWPSLILQGTVDHLYRFRDISIKFPGSCHDAVAFRNSHIFRNSENIIPKETRNIDGREIGYMLLGDPAYSLLDWLLKPYTGLLTPQEESFNCYLSSARIVVENAFGRLKARWRCLLKRFDIDYAFIPKVVMACCVLHNIVETNKDIFIENGLTAVREAEIVQPVPSETQASFGNGRAIRDHLRQYMSNKFPLRQSAIRQ